MKVGPWGTGATKKLAFLNFPGPAWGGKVNKQKGMQGGMGDAKSAKT